MDSEQDTTFYTATMARVLTGQGRYAAAARIYRHLLAQSPENSELAEALAQVTSLAEAARPTWKTVSPVVASWVRLLLHRRALQQFERIRMPAATEGASRDT